MANLCRKQARLRGAAAETLRIIAPAPRAATRMRGIPAAEHQTYVKLNMGVRYFNMTLEE